MKACLPLMAALILMVLSCRQKKNYDSWEVYGGNKENNHYSSLRTIDTSNVSRLQVAWQFNSGDGDSMTQMQVNPIVVEGRMFIVSPKLKLICIDPASGKKYWAFDPQQDSVAKAIGNWQFLLNVCRGITYYKEEGHKDSSRIFYAAGSRLYCIEAATGQPLKTFGYGGSIDLHNDLRTDAHALYVASTSPGIVYKDLIIIGTRVDENQPAAPGHIRAYDVHTGQLRWIFHTIPKPGEPGYETWDDPEAYKYTGGANAWSGFSLDEENGILFAPLGSATYDFYGGKRLGKNLYANSLLALDAKTGKRIWHFQTVHHDLWDRDLPTAPALVNVRHKGEAIPAVAQPTKSGYVFLFNRLTGQPLFPIAEEPVPTNNVLPGERAFPTQPKPLLPAPFVRQKLTLDELNNLVPESSQAVIKKQWSQYESSHMYAPPSEKGTIIFPGYDGGAEWGGPAVDPVSGIMYVNANEMPWILTMIPRKKDLLRQRETNLQAGKRLYNNLCVSCHGPDRLGGGDYPSLIGLEQKYKPEEVEALIAAGRRMMPSFNMLNKEERKALVNFLLNLKEGQVQPFSGSSVPPNEYNSLPYQSTGYHKFLTPEGYPAVKPPWGTLTAIDLNTGAHLWKTPLGEVATFKNQGLHTGTENYGGPVVTAGGLVFIAATSDKKIRAFNKHSGQLLWEHELPACGFATPATYAINGKQYIVIACGGGKLKQPSGDSYVAFALPD